MIRALCTGSLVSRIQTAKFVFYDWFIINFHSGVKLSASEESYVVISTGSDASIDDKFMSMRGCI